MSKVFRETANMTEGEWLEARREGIGGSDVGVIAGLSRYKSPMMLYLDKIGELQDQEAGEAAQWGHKLEAVVADEFKARTGFHVQRRNAILQHEDYPFMLANVDRLVRTPEGEWGVLECKTASEYKKGDWEGENVPETYYLQLQHYLFVTGYKFGYLAVLIGGNKYRQYKVVADPEIHEFLVQLESNFWSMVTERRMPQADGNPATTEYLNRIYASVEKGKVAQLPPAAKDTYEQYLSAAEERKAWEAKEEEYKNQLKAMVGDAEVGVIGDIKLKWSVVNQTRLDAAALEKAYPDIVKQFKKPSSYRKFSA